MNNNDVNKVSKIMIINGDRVLLLMSKTLKKFHFPGGHLEEKESYTHGLIREVKEETGLSLSWYKIVYTKPNFCLYKGGAYPSRIKLSDEHDSYVWAKIEEAHKYPLCNLTKKDIGRLQMGWERIKRRKKNNRIEQDLNKSPLDKVQKVG
jgi:8-oxo-dGTP pyrophosphatase MutT (NUDIX family)